MIKIIVDGASFAANESDLSARECQIAVAVAAGLGCKEIAQKLHLSLKTVSTYYTRVLEKLDVKSKVELLGYMIVKGYAKVEGQGLSEQAELRMKAKEARFRGFLSAKRKLPLDVMEAVL